MTNLKMCSGESADNFLLSLVVWKRPVRSSGGRQTSLTDPFFVSLSFVKSIRFLLQSPAVLSPSQESPHVIEPESCLYPKPDQSGPHSLPTDFHKIYSHFIFPSKPSSCKWPLSFGLSHQNPVCTSPLPFYMPHAPPIPFPLICSPG